MDPAETQYQLLWMIENYTSVVPMEVLCSINFTAERLEKTDWYFALWPKKLLKKEENTLSLHRCCHDAGPETVSVKLEISIITEDGSTLYSEQCEHSFRKGDTRYFEAFVDLSKLRVRKNADSSPRDTVGVRCRMWRGEGRVQKVRQYTARTIVKTENVCFEHKITRRNFSNLEINKRVDIPSRIKEECILSSDLWISGENSPERSIIVDVKSSNIFHRLLRKQISVIGVTGETRKLLDVDYRLKGAERTEEEMRKSFTKQFFMNCRREFSTNDELTLLCKCTFYTAEDISEFKETQLELLITAKQNINCDVLAKNDSQVVIQSAGPIASGIKKIKNVFKKGLPSYPTAPDSKAISNHQLLTDDESKTATSSFSTQPTLLSARSMLSNDMKGKKTYRITVDDSEDEIARQLLLFLYSDDLKNLQWDSALQIYHDADKYAVKSVKKLCSSFLIDNLSTSNASQVLFLADRHCDEELKETVEDFILAHEEEVFRSDEWNKLCKINSQLGVETMLLKCKRNESGQ